MIGTIIALELHPKISIVHVQIGEKVIEYTTEQRRSDLSLGDTVAVKGDRLFRIVNKDNTSCQLSGFRMTEEQEEFYV
jgi:hypothetical protein